jgi:hypothetical protein
MEDRRVRLRLETTRNTRGQSEEHVMTEIVEIHWNAEPHLANMRIKVKAGPLDPRAQDLFAEIRSGAADLFPGCVTIVRIATRTGGDAPLRMTRSANTDSQDGLAAVQAMVDSAVARAGAERQEPAEGCL